jgi:hypothetical protein
MALPELAIWSNKSPIQTMCHKGLPKRAKAVRCRLLSREPATLNDLRSAEQAQGPDLANQTGDWRLSAGFSSSPVLKRTDDFFRKTVEPAVLVLLGCGEKKFTKKDFGIACQGDGGRFEIFF